MISYFQFRDTHYCDTARTAGKTSPHGDKAAPASNGNGNGNGNGNNNSGGTNHVNNTQNNNQSNGVVNSSGGGRPSPRTDFGGFGTTPQTAGLQAQENFKQITQNFASFLDSTVGKLTQAVAETVGATDRTVSQEQDNGINERGHGDGDSQVVEGNCTMVGHTKNCFYSETPETEADPSTNTEYGVETIWNESPTVNVSDAENQDMPYGVWSDTELNTEGKDTGFVSPIPNPEHDHVDTVTWLKTLGFLPIIAIGGGIIYFARRKKR